MIGRFIGLLLFIGSSGALFSQNQLESIPNFTPNPGNLKGYIHFSTKKELSEKVPLVVALHGCTQNAKELADNTGWNKLADTFGFHVLYPEQRVINNGNSCFNWFRSTDHDKDQGEVYSIERMIQQVIKEYAIDTTRIFVYGLSAGAAMAVALMADYPELVNSGAILAGVAFGAANNASESFSMLMNTPQKTPEEWQQLIENQHPEFNGHYPKIIILQGTNDKVVIPENATELIEQWTSIHQIDRIPDDEIKDFNGKQGLSKSTYTNEKEYPLVIFYSAEGLGHQLMIDPGNGTIQGGNTGRFAIDADFFSTYWIAVDFGLIPHQPY